MFESLAIAAGVLPIGHNQEQFQIEFQIPKYAESDTSIEQILHFGFSHESEPKVTAGPDVPPPVKTALPVFTLFASARNEVGPDVPPPVKE